MEIKKLIEKYEDYLLEYNKKINVISRKMNKHGLKKLICETILLETHISKKNIVDAGSGNGIIGIPIALLNSGKHVYLVETKKKKTIFLEEIKNEMNLQNITVVCDDIKNFIKREGTSIKDISIVTRGFPRIQILLDFIKKGLITELILITSENKIKKILKNVVNVKKKSYNIPLKKDLKIIKMENVSRET